MAFFILPLMSTSIRCEHQGAGKGLIYQHFCSTEGALVLVHVKRRDQAHTVGLGVGLGRKTMRPTAWLNFSLRTTIYRQNSNPSGSKVVFRMSLNGRPRWLGVESSRSLERRRDRGGALVLCTSVSWARILSAPSALPSGCVVDDVSLRFS